MKIAIFGGSFNPVHNEHIRIVKAAIESLSLDKVIIMPSNITPLKEGRTFVDASDRLNMCRLAFGQIPNVVVSDYEISQSGVSYSYLTCRKFKESYPDAERFFIIGGDMLESFAEWKNPQEILNCVTLAVCAREDSSRFEKARIDFSARFGKEIKVINYVGGNISSTRIRALAALGENVEGLVCREVGKYICDNSLYLLDGAEKVKKSLSEFRWKHTLGVAVTAAENCTRYNVPERVAVTAALFHDCGKELSADSALISGCRIPEDVPPPVVHQYTGAYLAERIYGIKDKEILDAIRFHCSGRENMSSLEKLIYLSDMLEEGRTYDGVEELREIFKKDKDEAFLIAVERQLRRLEASGFPVYDLTRKAYKYAKEHKYD